MSISLVIGIGVLVVVAVEAIAHARWDPKPRTYPEDD